MVGGEPNGSNQVGVAPGAKWISAKVFDSAGSTTDAALLSAAEWIMAPGGRVDLAPDVVNNSWSGGSGVDEWYRETVKAWRAADIFPMFSAGNVTYANPGGPGSVATPANYPESFAVGATDNENIVANFSLRGPSPYGEIKPDISAPGVAIRSTLPAGKYGTNNGTSMASPAVAGVVALLRQANSNLTVSEIEEILINTAVPLTDSQYPESPNHGYGNGLVDAYSAVSSILEGAGIIEGIVTKQVIDSEPPTYEYEAPIEVYSNMDLELTVNAKDDVSILSVELAYQTSGSEWKTVPATRTSGDYKQGEYTVTVPKDEVNVGTIKYSWIINDFGSNTVTSEEYVLIVNPGITVGYLEDFESEPTGWISYGEKNSWEWGIPTSGPETAASGEKVYATNLDGPYEKDMDATLEMLPIDLPEETTFLQFKGWHNFTELYGYEHYGRVMISTDKENWTELQRFTRKSEGWESHEIDLTAYSGERVYIGFNAYSDFRISNLGWYIDDVALSDTSQYSDDAIPPTFEHVATPVTYSGLDLDLEIQVDDNFKIASVDLQYKIATAEWQTISSTPYLW